MPGIVLSRNDGPYDTTVSELAHGRLRFFWVVVDRRDKRTRSDRASTEEWAKHDARKALSELRAEVGEEAEAA